MGSTERVKVLERALKRAIFSERVNGCKEAAEVGLTALDAHDAEGKLDLAPLREALRICSAWADRNDDARDAAARISEVLERFDVDEDDAVTVSLGRESARWLAHHLREDASPGDERLKARRAVDDALGTGQRHV